MALLINAVSVLAIALALSQASAWLGPKRRMEEEKGLPYETGMPPMEPAMGHMWVAYYRFAVLFVIFDVDLVFVIPWILLRHELALEHMIAMTVFLGFVMFMLVYVWKKRALECD